MLTISNNQIRLTRGDTAVLHVDIINDDTPYELQPEDDVTFTMRRTTTDPDILIQKHGNPIIIEPVDTKDLKFGNYVYDIQVTFSTGIVDTIVPPTSFTITEEVTW